MMIVKFLLGEIRPQKKKYENCDEFSFMFFNVYPLIKKERNKNTFYYLIYCEYKTYFWVDE